MLRQGDVLIKAADGNPTGRRVEPKAGRLILARGEATGHHHSVAADTCEMYEAPGGMWLVVNEPTPLVHQEHAAIEIAPGTYWVVRQREYSIDEERQVVD